MTDKTIREFAGNVIYNRGYDYYIDNMVEDFEYDPVKKSIQANIHGSLGNYSIEVWELNDQIEADCDCPIRSR